ncbi:monocarboxylate transporter 11-like isoform X3 [Amphiura filiformis]|uniref:monocarboxylate transporter 11-like isoform X3 n=1 Tax=Amphiura filiformis TaxID=82378 RepID=UPI003B21CBF1
MTLAVIQGKRNISCDKSLCVVKQAMARQTHSTDTGWAWMILLASCMVLFMWDGLRKGLSVLLPTLKEQFETHTWMIGLMIALSQAVRDFTAPIAGYLANTVDNRLLGIIGGLIAALSVTTASFAPNVPTLVILGSIIYGIAMALVTVPCYSLLGQYFDRHYLLACSLFQGCGSLGMMIFAPLTQLLLDTYGWRNTLLLLGAMYFHVFVGGALLRKPNIEPDTDEQTYIALKTRDVDDNAVADREYDDSALRGWIYDQTGTYDVGFYYLGAMQAVDWPQSRFGSISG